jgi:hypothetical protein
VLTQPPSTSRRTDPVSWVVRHAAPVVGVVFLVGLAVRQAMAPLDNDDTFFHLRYGAEFLQGWSLGDPGSVTGYATRDWVPTQWLPQVGMARVEELGGLAAVSWVTGLVFVAYAVVLYLAARQEGPALAAALTAVLALGASGQGLSARPQVLSYLLVAVVVAAWLRSCRDGRVRWWLVPLTWAWAMLHGMWPIAVVIGLVAVVGGRLDGTFRGGLLLRQAAVPLLCGVAAALTPLGPRLVAEVVTVASRGSYFAEWGPPEFTGPHALTVAAMLGVTILLLVKGGPVSWTHTLLLLLAGGWAIYSMRTIPVAAAMAAPLAAAALGRLLPARADNGRDRWLAVGTGVVGVALLAVLVPSSAEAGPERPAWADQRLDDLPAGTRVLNNWDWGGWLMYRHPHLELLMHGYGDSFTTEELDRNVEISRVQPGWHDLVAEVDADYALVDPDTALGYALVEGLGWTVVEDSEDMQLLTPPAD